MYLHGGVYLIGSGNSDWYGPDFLIEQNVILVTINYRLGIFGFLSLDSPEYSGNMGLKDQQMALRWLHSNIEYFSGDNQRITVFGDSAGGVSAHFHMMSSESRKYFRNAILMSGTVDVAWAMNSKSDHLAMAFKIADDLGQPKHSIDELVELLKAAPANKIAKYGAKGFTERTMNYVMAPIIESNAALPL